MYFYIHNVDVYYGNCTIYVSTYMIFCVTFLGIKGGFARKCFCEFFLIEVKVLLPRSKFGVAVAPSKKKTAQVGKNASQNIKQYVDWQQCVGKI